MPNWSLSEIKWKCNRIKHGWYIISTKSRGNLVTLCRAFVHILFWSIQWTLNFPMRSNQAHWKSIQMAHTSYWRHLNIPWSSRPVFFFNPLPIWTCMILWGPMSTWLWLDNVCLFWIPNQQGPLRPNEVLFLLFPWLGGPVLLQPSPNMDMYDPLRSNEHMAATA